MIRVIDLTEEPGQDGPTKAERIDRLRKRLKQVPQRSEADGRFVAVLQGVLDLLGDEL